MNPRAPRHTHHGAYGGNEPVVVKCARAIQQCIASSVPPCGRHLPCLLCVSPGTDGAIGNEANGDSVGTGGVRSGLERACSKNSRGLRPRPMNARHKRGQHVRPRDPARSVRLAPFGTASSGDGTGVGRRGESSEGRRGVGNCVTLTVSGDRGGDVSRLRPPRRGAAKANAWGRSDGCRAPPALWTRDSVGGEARGRAR